jgi:hypothetical protein
MDSATMDRATRLALISAFGLDTGFVPTRYALEWMRPRLGGGYSVAASTEWDRLPSTSRASRAPLQCVLHASLC